MPLVRAELFKLSRRMMPRILLGIIVVGTLALYGLFLLVLRTSSQATDPETVRTFEDLRRSLRVEAVRDFGLGGVRGVGTILAVILGVAIISSEYSWGTIRTVLPRAGGRASFLTAKYLVLVGFVVTLVVLGFLAALAGSAIISAVEDLPAGLGGDAVPQTIAAIGRTVFVMLPYVALGFLIAVLTRSTAAGIAIGLVVLFGEGIGAGILGALGSPFEAIPDALLSRNVAAVVQANALPDDAAGGDLPNAWQGAGVLLLYIAAFVALAYQRFLARDVTSSSE